MKLISDRAVFSIVVGAIIITLIIRMPEILGVVLSVLPGILLILMIWND